MSELEKSSEELVILRDEKGRILPGQQSLNPLGKPKGARHLTTLVREAMMEVAKTKDGKEVNVEKALVKTIIEKAIIEGDTQIIKLIWNYLDGLPKASLEIEDNRVDETKEQLRAIMSKLNGGKE
jgi:hypothetical protein